MQLDPLLAALALVVVSSVVIKYASDSFETASSYLGRRMAAGIKGATINAIGSSMPELLTTAVFLFAYHDLDGFSAGVATAAGSAVFNGLVIPSLCIFVVAFFGVKRAGRTERVRHIEVDSRTVLRDGIWLVVGEITLIVFLGTTTLTWVAGACLLLCYVGYILHLMHHNRVYGAGTENDEETNEGSGGASTELRSRMRALLKLDFNEAYFRGRPFNARRAWIVLASSVSVLAAACFLLAEAVVESAQALGVPTYFTAVVLAAAATSVPDTVLSVKDARNGLYDDAVSNALGSNIFDIAVSLGLPLLVYSLIYGDVSLTAATGASAADVQSLRILLLCVTVVVIVLFLAGRKAGVGKASVMLVLYLGWMTWIADSAFDLGLFISESSATEALLR